MCIICVLSAPFNNSSERDGAVPAVLPDPPANDDEKKNDVPKPNSNTNSYGNAFLVYFLTSCFTAHLWFTVSQSYNSLGTLNKMYWAVFSRPIRSQFLDAEKEGFLQQLGLWNKRIAPSCVGYYFTYNLLSTLCEALWNQRWSINTDYSKLRLSNVLSMRLYLL